MKGNLLFSIAHLPTAGRMTLAVIQAKEVNASLDDKDTGIKRHSLELSKNLKVLLPDIFHFLTVSMYSIVST